MTLDDLAVKHGTDKGSTSHWYTRHYERIFGPSRMEIDSVCEVGVGGGDSLRMWRDYFPNATIHGVDIEHKDDMGTRIVLHQIEQTDCDTLRERLHDKHLEIIVEDASHDPEKSIKTLDALWPTLEYKGWYVIEDMGMDLFPELIGQWCRNNSSSVRQIQIYQNDAALTFIQKQ